MHRIHHSIEVSETNSNYGFNLSIWDRLLNSYIAVAKAGNNLIIGLREYRKITTTTFLYNLIILPFRKN